jgi:hypothetical protein
VRGADEIIAAQLRERVLRRSRATGTVGSPKKIDMCCSSPISGSDEVKPRGSSSATPLDWIKFSAERVTNSRRLNRQFESRLCQRIQVTNPPGSQRF